MKTINLSDIVENPDNPQTVTDDDFNRLVEKLRRVPEGLRAMRIAYVTDDKAGKYVVISGNKRLRALKVIYGEKGVAPIDWFQDVTAMSDEERREFIVDANVVEGNFDADKILKLYTKEDLVNWMDSDTISKILEVAESAEQNTGNASSGSDGVSLVMTSEKVEYVIELTTDDYVEVVEFLRNRNSDIDKAFAEVIHERA